MTPEQHQREAQIADSLRMEREARINASVTGAVDDIRHNVVERPWYGRDVTDTIDRPLVTVHGQETAAMYAQGTAPGAGPDAGNSGTVQPPAQGNDIHGNPMSREAYLENAYKQQEQAQGASQGRGQGQGMEP